MSGIWQVFRSDLRRATSSVMAMIVLCGLIVIPSAFTWFNVIGSWSPFDNTKNLKVAVASVDEGYDSPLIPVHVNLGSVVESALRANDQLDWVITTKQDAIAGTTSGEYYAAMVLPKDFSERMLTFYTAGSQRTQVDYYTNDKSNPLAPLITSEGADDLTAKINAEFTKELGNVALSLVSSLATSLGDPESKAALVRVQTQLNQVAVQMRAASGTARTFTSLIEAGIPLINGASGLLYDVDAQFSSAAGGVREGISAAERSTEAIARASQALSTAFAAGKAQLDRFGSEVDRIFSGIDADAAANASSIRAMATGLEDLVADQETLRTSLEQSMSTLPEEDQAALEATIDGLDAAIEQERALAADLSRMASTVEAGNGDLQQFRGQIESRVSAAQAALASAGTTYENDLKPVLEELGRTLTAVGSALDAVTDDVASVSGSTRGIVSVLEAAAQDNSALADVLSKTADEATEVTEALSAAIDSGDLSKVAQIIGAHPSVLAAAIAQPIGLDRIPVYPVVSFGAGMAPLYSILSLWVGALLLAVTLRVEPPTKLTDDGPELTVDQRFLGRYMIFGVMGLAQSTLVMLGNILLVGLHPVHPFLLMLCGWVTSLVFTFLIYTLVVSFSDAGKALAVFLLVIQVAGAGGAYPLALLPQWFQNVSPFLPATHSIDAFRAALAGIYQADYWISLAWLLAFLVPALLLGLALRRPLIGLNAKMEEMLQSTQLM
jgi:putative membrane protein